ncbi:MAG: hypothetical protein A2283_11935 [Lentisphaerae bacterium RIFOXYA12_FULL_48_11]|nr:MAG: hypothetical protein A2283_11935 [Lentisphaerae bacterium RIFOXYA12_FULL_48_11]
MTKDDKGWQWKFISVKIAIDTNPIYTTQAGTARYVNGLLRGLRQLSVPDLSVVPLAWETENFGYDQPGRILKTIWRELIWAPMIAPFVLRRNATDLLHITGGLVISIPRGIKSVHTILDCAVLRNPSRFRRWQRWTGGLRLHRQVVNADRIICISRFVAEEIMSLLGVPASRLDVVYLGSDFNDTGNAEESSPEGMDIQGEFFLFVGSLEPGKNLNLLRQVYELASARNVHLPPLIVVGARWAGVSNEGKVPGNWIYLGHQPDAVLRYLYRRAIALVFPSKYEGFGLPVLEAMSMGCPVICSKVASLPEVGGDAVKYADQTPGSYYDAMLQLMRNNDERQILRKLGYEQAGRFSWCRCVEETVSVYRSVIEGK